MNNRKIFRRTTGNSPRIWLVVLIILAFIIAIMVINYFGKAKVEETYTERTLKIQNGTIIETELVSERTYRIDVEKLSKDEMQSGSTWRIQERTVGCGKIPKSQELHFPESTYVAGAIMVNGEAGGVSSITERSGCLWIACNRVMSDDPYYPDDLESVIAQIGAFDGYNPNGTYTEADYRLAVDVFERFWREQNGESSVSVGRSIPADYLYFWGDGDHNYFTKSQGGAPYVWGSMFISPYIN